MSAWLPTATCTPQACATHPGRTVGVAGAVVRLVAGSLVLIGGAALSPLVALLGAAPRDLLTRRWSRTVLRAFGLRVHIDGPPRDERGPGGGVLVVSNHVSWLDVPLIASVFPGRMLAKSEIRRWPVLGQVAAGGGTLFVERERLRALPDTVRTLAAALTRGSRVIVFPEACTWCGKDEGRFTSAVFQAALNAGTPVRPVRISYRAGDGRLSGATAFVGEDNLGASLWRVVRAGGLTAEIAVLPALAPAPGADRRWLARAAREAVQGSRAPATAQLGGPFTRPTGPRTPLGGTAAEWAGAS
jgi:1-acyl-sn-glycerol-3-phosphate acyltransferase